MAARFPASSDPSAYVASLCDADKERYAAKIKACGVDPFSLDALDCAVDVNLWPRINMCDIHDYLVSRTSFVTRKQLKAYRSLEAHNYVTSGWVKAPWLKQVGHDSVIALTQVNHSQSLSVPPVKVWIFAESDGEVLAAHCVCMAGNGEACSHVAALLFYIEHGQRLREERSCTDGVNQWLPPHIRKIEARPIAEMDFASSTMKKRRLDGDAFARCAANGPPRTPAPPPSKEELKKFFDDMVASGLRPVMLSTDSRYSHLYRPAARACTGADLRLLYDRGGERLGHEAVLEKCDEIFRKLTISEQAINSIERRTRSQALSAKWFTFRTGRVTASTLYDVCHTKLESPSLALVKRICNPERQKLTVPSVRYGRMKEVEALAKYREVMHELHDSIEFQDAGLFVCKEHLFLAATPDLLVSCTCCGAGVVEVKCPWKVRDGHLEDLLKDENSCVTQCDSELVLKKTHRYYYQVQAQMFVCKVNYADFILWNKNGINVQRIPKDDTFIVSQIEKAENFFKKVLLPELVVHWFSRDKENADGTQTARDTSASTSTEPSAVLTPIALDQSENAGRAQTARGISESTSTEPSAVLTAVAFGQNSRGDVASNEMYCLCKGPERGKMIACDSDSCDIKWFHFSCVGLKKTPRCKTWFCQSCSLQNANRC